MDASLINPFIQSSQNVLQMVCMEAPKLGQLSVKKQPYQASVVSVAITIFGDVNGEVAFNMSVDAGCYIASKMMGGMPVPVLDDISSSALSELANMISGNVCTVFSGKKMKVDISTPRFKMNASTADFQMIAKQPKIVCVPLNFQVGHTFTVDIVLE
jgi:chemotaxis protein CheX